MFVTFEARYVTFFEGTCCHIWSYNQRQKCWHIWAKQTLLSASFHNFKNVSFADCLTPSPPCQCWHCHVVTTLKRWEGVEMWKLEIELKAHDVWRNRSFSGSVSTAFVHDCRYVTFFQATCCTSRSREWKDMGLTRVQGTRTDFQNSLGMSFREPQWFLIFPQRRKELSAIEPFWSPYQAFQYNKATVGRKKNLKTNY